ncbi:RecB family exonuclease [Acinetobacter radioresistens]|uniref:RecB family exonuclease n=1 Tax=Acinetobacter radioresistens TaxID=40216 RepID=UPI00200417C0|nr:PD-(D/E)XK nuclease family protein [Acinetobacter radioresistens]MCK4081951.1 PD-(D/E)XK nuclease family protein [Acinetobacter radioresistens]MCK4091273.1 PD-(D/E)XK nuclease family protein [Acinetobacter radioresistens]
MNAAVNLEKIIPIRASSLSDLFDCPARWEAKNLLNKRIPAGARTRLGTAVHEAVTQWDYLNLIGEDVTLEECREILHHQIWQPGEEVDWSDLDQNAAEAIGHSLMQKYITHIAPTQKFIGVEVRCESLILADLGIELTGTIDRIYENNEGELGIGDLKSGKNAVASDGTVKTVGHVPQMGIYTVLASHALQEPVLAPARIYGLTTGKTDKGQHVGIGEINSPAEVLLGTEEEPGLLHHAAKLIKHGVFYGNSKSMMCHDKYCPVYHTCKFRK